MANLTSQSCGDFQPDTVNGERFAELNFHGFRGFEEDRENFSMNILYMSYN